MGLTVGIFHAILLMKELMLGDSDLAAPEIIKFGIESKFSSPLTSTSNFKEIVTETLKDMRGICLAGLVTPEDTPVRSHL